MHLECFLHRVRMRILLKPLRNRSDPNFLGFSTFVEVLLPALRGEHIFETKNTKLKIQSKYCHSIEFSESRDRTKWITSPGLQPFRVDPLDNLQKPRGAHQGTRKYS